jgi:hypothetical protein
MRVTIIPCDRLVIVDGVAKRDLDLSFMADVHAVQWYDTWGDVERTDAQFKHSNEHITSIAPYQAAIDAWNAAPSGE